MAQPSLYDKLMGSRALPLLDINPELADKLMALFRRILLACKRKNVNPRDVAITGPFFTKEGRVMFKVKYGKENPGSTIGLGRG